MRDLLGGKGAGLAEMTRLGLPVPPGFTITTKACNAFARTGRFPPGLWKQVESALSTVETKIGRRFGDPSNPLLVSVRSGAKFSMPGMMDTVLNLGLNDETVETLGRISNERFAWDSYRRLIAMFGRIVKDVDGRKFEAILERDPPRPRDRRERADDGLREHGTRLRNGRCVHPKPFDRREATIRGVLVERPGRGCRRGDPHAPDHRPAAGDLPRSVRPVLGG